MKKALILLMSIGILQACSNNDGETGSQNDGIQPVDPNGGAADTAWKGNQSGTDTSKGEHRVDISKRDTFEKPSQHP